ncbi:MAG: hypothetical protein ACYCTV_07660 [Leptospirales bacterium]
MDAGIEPVFPFQSGLGEKGEGIALPSSFRPHRPYFDLPLATARPEDVSRHEAPHPDLLQEGVGHVAMPSLPGAMLAVVPLQKLLGFEGGTLDGPSELRHPD